MSFKYALQAYIERPDDFPNSVVYKDEEVVIIKDLYPKALRHLLILPRNKHLSRKHPLDAFQSVDLWDDFYEYVEKTKDIIMDDLFSRGLLKFEKNSSLASDFRNTFIRAGVHSIPSLNNLHIHVITQDFYLPYLKHKKHYNSFTTAFFVAFGDLEPESHGSTGDFLAHDGEYDSQSPDEDEAPVFATKHERSPNKLEMLIKGSPLACTACDKKFGNKFQDLKKHLEREFELKFNAGAND